MIVFYLSSYPLKNLQLRVLVVKWEFSDIKEILSVDFTRKEEPETSIVNEMQDCHCHLATKAAHMCVCSCLNAATYNSQYELISAGYGGVYV